MIFFQSALLRYLQPFSVMPLSTKCKHNYRDKTISGAATLLSLVSHSPYLRFCCRLFYFLITEAEENQSADVGFAESDTPLFPDGVPICI